MDHPSDREELLAAWRALGSGDEANEGWRTIPLALGKAERLRAGRHFPENAEALLVSFDGVATLPARFLPHGRGFDVCSLELPDGSARMWIALRRNPDASLDLFTTMAEDLASALARSSAQTEVALFHQCLYRIRAWQEFMGSDGPDVLGSEAELGLFGEIAVLKMLIEAGLETDDAIQAWIGPEDGLQDFRLGHGVLEVKTTAAAAGFPARVGSLEQLDDSAFQPLVVAAVRLGTEDSGFDLPGLIAAVQWLLVNHPVALNKFQSKLIRVGYLDASAKRYKRRFNMVQMRLLLVDASFPRLTRHAVPAAVTHASYVVDLDRVPARSLSGVTELLEKMGAI